MTYLHWLLLGWYLVAGLALVIFLAYTGAGRWLGERCDDVADIILDKYDDYQDRRKLKRV